MAAENRNRSDRQRQLLDRIFRPEDVPPTETQLMAVATIDHRINVIHERTRDGSFNPTEVLHDITDNMMFLAVNRYSRSYPNTIEAFDRDHCLIGLDCEYGECAVWRLIYCLLASQEAQAEFIRLCLIACDLLQYCLYFVQWRVYAEILSDIVRPNCTIH